MPLDNWQFYVVTLAALWGAWAVARPFFRGRRKRRTHLTVSARRRR